MEFVIISGLSGAGKSRTAGVLEDMDFYVVDNMPVALMPKFAEMCMATRGRYERVALVTDVRGGESFDELFAALDEMTAMGCEYKIVFIEASAPAIIKRYKETRRRHPLDPDGSDLAEAVERESKLLSPVREKADLIIDSTNLKLSQLQRTLMRAFSTKDPDKSIDVNVISFGFKYGIPIEADLVFDVRFLPNPFYVAELKDKTGKDQEVCDYVMQHEEAQTFVEKLKDMISFLLPHYIEEGKSSVIICIGCTGGHHRSVTLARVIAEYVTSLGYSVNEIHRDVGKN